ncbi:MAG: ribosomal rRNA E-loop binding protein Ctc/L25/TL5 [Pseudomonadota bacterium]|jgi:large subunit ribosomal protein L25
MVGSFEFIAQKRDVHGKGAMRRMRNTNQVPAVLYGGDRAPESLVLVHHEVVKLLQNDAVYSHILDVVVDGVAQRAILKAIQRHPAKPVIMHMDFQRVSDSDLIHVHVPLHFVNQAGGVGVKKGGIAMHNMVEVEVICLPGALPDAIEVDVAYLDIGQSLHLTDLRLPAGVQLSALLQGADHDHPVVTIKPPVAAEA